MTEKVVPLSEGPNCLITYWCLRKPAMIIQRCWMKLLRRRSLEGRNPAFSFSLVSQQRQREKKAGERLMKGSGSFSCETPRRPPAR